MKITIIRTEETIKTADGELRIWIGKDHETGGQVRCFIPDWIRPVDPDAALGAFSEFQARLASSIKPRKAR